jgi:hypothetical protein
MKIKFGGVLYDFPHKGAGEFGFKGFRVNDKIYLPLGPLKHKGKAYKGVYRFHSVCFLQEFKGRSKTGGYNLFYSCCLFHIPIEKKDVLPIPCYSVFEFLKQEKDVILFFNKFGAIAVPQ